MFHPYVPITSTWGKVLFTLTSICHWTVEGTFFLDSVVDGEGQVIIKCLSSFFNVSTQGKTEFEVFLYEMFLLDSKLDDICPLW